MSIVKLDKILVLLTVGCHFLPCCLARFQVCIVGSEHKEYDSSIKICCNGQIKQRAGDQECCNDQTLYLTSSYICCGGKVQDRFVPPKGSTERSCSSNDEQCHEQTCCGDKAMDTNDAICCQQQPVYLNHTQQLERDFLQCCGKTIINKLSYFCCGDTRYSRNKALECCEEKVFDNQAEKCLTKYRPHKVVSKYKNICGNQEYDMRNSSCCSGTLHNKPELNPLNPLERNPILNCCDNIIYDITKEKCCRESHTGFPTHTITNLPNNFCCGNDSYNATHQDCYNGIKLEKVTGKVRCGYEYIDGTIEKCCMNTKYNAVSHKCCKGDKFNVIPKDHICCNGEGINKTMLCCEGMTPSLKRKPDDDQCCYNYKTKRAETYRSSNNEHCVHGEVLELPHGVEACGIFKFYFPKTHICCGEKVYDINTVFDSCCGDHPYNSATQQCCNYVISDISTKEGSCCSKDFLVYRFDDARNPCRSRCGNSTCDDTHQICCQGIVHEANDDTECCGSSTINSAVEGCCGGHFPWLRNGNTRCCGDKDLYNKEHAKCMGNKIVLRDLALGKLSNAQYLCSRSALKYFDGGIKYACESQYIIIARLVKVQVLEEIMPNITYINLSFADVAGLDRGDKFSTWAGPHNLVISIEVPKHKDIKCRKGYFSRYCKTIVYFSGRIKGGHVKLGKSAKFFMTSYTRKREIFLTKKLPYEFCKSNFNVR